MLGTVLRTKLYIPPKRPSLVPRPALIQKLNNGVQQGRKLSVVAAPAGFGKTTLVNEWLLSSGRPSAWLSLDEGDADLGRFLLYFITALQTVVPEVGADVLAALQSSQMPPIESILTVLLNDISAVSTPFFFVLDDYHVVDSHLVDEALAFVIEHMPPQMHLIMTTREDPNLPLARWRVRSQLTELRANDLRFGLTEATDFIRRVMGLNLSQENIRTLESRTEGWIAGLQLAALSMQGREDNISFIESFSGDNRYIVDYLVEEVLRHQPEATRRFLLQTAVLDRLNASLCTAVTELPEAKTLLEELDRGNFFLIALDDKRHWYRYHHLFGEVLRVNLTTEFPETVASLHLQASDWYEQNGLTADAIHHTLAAGDYGRTAVLVERSLPEMRQTRQEQTLLSWFQALPAEVFHKNPVLSVQYAGTLLQNGHLAGVEPLLENAERWVDIPPNHPEQPQYIDQEDFNRLPISVAMYRAALSQSRGETDKTLQYTRKALEITPEDDYFLRGAVSSLMALALWTNGDLEMAYQKFASGMAYLERVGFTSDVIGGSVTLADIRLTQGSLQEAMRIYQHGLALALKDGPPVLRGAADMYVGIGDLYRERNDLKSAEEHLRKGQELGDLNGLPKNPYRWRAVMARILEAQGDLAGAQELLEEAAPLFVADFSPNVRPVTAVIARLWIVMGRLDDAIGWAKEQKLSASDDLSYLREFEHITLARLLLAQARNGRKESAIEAAALLQRLLTFAEAGGRMGAALEILILLALTHQLQEDISGALTAFGRALDLAEPEGYIRLFVDEGPPMADLLREATSRGLKAGYVEKLLAAFGAETSSVERLPSKPSSLMEPLSQRELEVLRLFKTELSGPEIAEELVVALSTVRTHTKGIYSKLNVSNRRSAVIRAEELGLI